MRVETVGFAPLFAEHHKSAIQESAKRGGRSVIPVRPIARTWAEPNEIDPEIPVKYPTVAVVVERWQNTEGDRWLVVKPATAADAKATEDYDEAYRWGMMDPRSGAVRFYEDEKRREAARAKGWQG